MTLTRFTPLRSNINDMAVLQNRLNSIFSDFLQPNQASDSLAAGNFIPAVDVYEDAQKLVLKLEVPGIPAEALDIRLEGRTLTVKGERKFENEVKEENIHRIERRYGSFARSFTLPTTVDAESVDAQTADGVLTLSLAKKAEAKPKQITVKAAAAPVPEVKQMEAQAA